MARSDGSSLDTLLSKTLERHRSDLLEEIIPDLTGAVLLSRSLVGACSGKTAMVHLLHTYSNTSELLTDLEAVTWTVRRANLQDEPTLPSTERVWRLCDRLSEAEMDAVVASYFGGTSVAQLTRQYGINHWGVNKLAGERGHRFRQESSDSIIAAP